MRFVLQNGLGCTDKIIGIPLRFNGEIVGTVTRVSAEEIECSLNKVAVAFFNHSYDRQKVSGRGNLSDIDIRVGGRPDDYDIALNGFSLSEEKIDEV